MKRTEKMAEFLNSAANGATIEEIEDGTGLRRGDVSTNLKYWVKCGRAVQSDDGKFTLNPQYVRYAALKAPRKLPPKVKGFKAAARAAKAKAAAKKPRTYGDLLDKIRADDPLPVYGGDADMKRLLVDHARHTFDALQLTIDLSDAEPSTVAAFKSHQQVLTLLGGDHG